MCPHEQYTPQKVIDIILAGGIPSTDPHLYQDMHLWLLVKQYLKYKEAYQDAAKSIFELIKIP